MSTMGAELQNVTDMTDTSVQKYLQVGLKSLGEHVISKKSSNVPKIFTTYVDRFLCI